MRKSLKKQMFKKAICLVSSVALAVTCVDVASVKAIKAAETTFSVDGIKYSVTAGGQVAVSGSGATDQVIIPDKVTYNDVTYKVTSIAKEAFKGNSGITKVEIPDSVSTLGYAAFYDAKNLQEVRLSKKLKEIPDAAFEGCKALENIEIPDSVITIGKSVFKNCDAFVNVDLGKNVQKLGYYSFQNCDNIETLKIPKTLTSLEGYEDAGILSGCPKLKRIELPEGITVIPNRLYAYITSGDFEEVTIPDTVKEIGSGAFRGCTSIKSIKIPDSVSVLNTQVFSNATNLSEVDLGKTITNLPDAAFEGCIALKEIEIPDSVITIGKYAFGNCDSFVNVDLGKNVQKLGYYAFEKCDNLETLKIPKTLTSLEGFEDAGILNGCPKLKRIELPEGITVIPNRLYAYITSGDFEEVTIPDTVKEIGSGAFRGCTSIKSIKIPDSVSVLNTLVFSNATNLSEVDLGKTITNLPDYAFEGCIALKEIEIPDSVITIGKYAFGNCDSFVNVDLGKNVQKLGYYAFEKCDNLETLKIPKTLASLEGYENAGILNGCPKLKRIELPDGITKIPNRLYAFISSGSFEQVTIPDSVTTLGDGAFKGCTALKTLYIPDSVKVIGGEVFSGAENLQEVKLSENLVEIPNNTFSDCRTLKKIEIPDSVTVIGTYAFKDCDSLVNVDLGNNLQKLGYYAFINCDRLETVKIPKSFIGLSGYGSGGMFAGCPRLRKVELPEGLTIIPNYFFAGITSFNMEEINIPASVKVIGANAFEGSNYIKNLTIPDGVVEIGAKAFSNTPNMNIVLANENIEKLSNNSFDREGSPKIKVPIYSKSIISFIDNEYDIDFVNNQNQFADEYVINAKESKLYSDVSDVVNNVILTSEFSIKTEEKTKIRNLKLLVKVPSTSAVIAVRVDGNTLATNQYSVSNNNLIEIPVGISSTKCEVFTTGDDNGKVIAYSRLYYIKDGKKCYDLIGAVNSNCRPITITSKHDAEFKYGDKAAYIDVSGTALPNQSVKLYVGDTLFTTVSSSKTGKYKATLKLEKPKEYKKYILGVVSVNEKNIEVRNECEVVTRTQPPKLVSAVMEMDSISSNGKKREYDILDYENLSYITFVPKKEYSFKIKYENRESIGKVYVTSTRNGIDSILEAVWNEKTQTYETKGFFENDPRYVPGELRIHYTESDDEREKSRLQYNADGTVYASEKFKSQMPEQWKNATYKQLLTSDSEYAVEVELGNGAVIDFESDTIKIEDFIEDWVEEEYGIDVDLSKVNANSNVSGKSVSKKSVYEDVSCFNGFATFIADVTGDKRISTGVDLLDKIGIGVSQVKGRNVYQYFENDGTTMKQVIFDSTDANNEAREYVYSKVKDKYAGTVAQAAGLGETEVGAMFGSAEASGRLFGLTMTAPLDYAAIMSDPTLSEAAKQAKCAELKKHMEEELYGIMFDYMYYGILAAAAMGLIPGGPMLVPLIELARHIWDNREKIDKWINDFMAKFKWIVDPSGYVYEGVATNRLPDVTTELYYKDALEDENSFLWNASEYDQKNPLTTDDNGNYAWDVPYGFWSVKAFKEGYNTVETEYMEVPPIRTDVNIKMYKVTGANVKYFFPHETYAMVEFDEYMEPNSIKELELIANGDKKISYTLVYDQSEMDLEGNVYAKEYKLVYADTELVAKDEVTLNVTDKVVNSGNVSAKADSIKATIAGDSAQDIHTDTGIRVNGFQINSKLEGIRMLYTTDNYVNGCSIEEVGVILSVAEMADESDMTVGSTSKYVTVINATDKGNLGYTVDESTISTTYAMTILFSKKSKKEFSTAMGVRPFVVLSDGTYVYGDTVTYSIFDVAKNLYESGEGVSDEMRDYCYNDILKKVQPDFKK